MNNNALHHLHVRKRMYKNLELYPHTSPLKRWVDRIAYVVGIAAPLFSIPQLYQIWSTHNAAGVSLLSWGAFTIASFFWVFYGIVHKEAPILVSQILWSILQIFIVIGIIRYS